MQYKFSVPEGSIIKTNAYNDFGSFNNVGETIQESLIKAVYNNYKSIEKCAQTIQNSIKSSEFPLELVNEIELKYRGF